MDERGAKILESCRRVLSYSETRGYAGYGKFDALNSPFLKACSLNRPFLRFVITQAVMRFPVNIRPLFGVRKSRNPKGIGLFAQVYMLLHELLGGKGNLERAEHCLEWLLDNSTPGYAGRCWGYNFDWQNSSLFYAPRGFPNCVTSVVCGEALLLGYLVTGNRRYLDGARETANFILSDLPVLFESASQKCIGYVPIRGINVVINVNALAAAFLSKLGRVEREAAMVNEALKLARYVVWKQTDYGAWYYTDPPKHSYIGHDNYHTGFILDGILETCENAGTEEFMGAYRRGMDFYAKHLFEKDGAPRYMSNRKHPYDIHGAAQGIITLSKAARFEGEYLDMAQKTAAWTVSNMQRADGSFSYQIGRLVHCRFTLMRWCNAWMARALVELLRHSSGGAPAGSRGTTG